MFNAAFRQIQDSELPEALRYLKFLHCIEWYCWLTKQKFQETYLRLGKMYGFDWQEKPDGAKLIEATKHLHAERAAFLAKLKEFQTIRYGQKHKGQRVPNKNQIKELYSPDRIY
jgi:hypothetical protein